MIDSPKEQTNFNGKEYDDEIDFHAILDLLWDSRWLIIVITTLFTLGGGIYGLLQTPIYLANSLIQVEEKHGGLPGMDDLAGMFENSSSSATEIQLIKSRHVLGKVVDTLNLDIVVKPHFFPIIGEAIARKFDGSVGSLPKSLLGREYAWGGEKLTISRMSVPKDKGSYLLRTISENEWQLLSHEGDIVLQGTVGQAAEDGKFAMMVTELDARPGTLFNVIKQSHYSSTIKLQNRVNAIEKGRGSGIIELSYSDKNPVLAEKILDEIGENYVLLNVERNSAEAAKSLEFLRNAVPDIKKDLERAEEKLNNYLIETESIDISEEGVALLDQMVELDTRISELEIKRGEIEQRFQPTHPRYKAWSSQMAELKRHRKELEKRIANLPKTQQKLVRLRRNVEVGNKIYLQMLSNIQQLDIARAGTVGNVRVVDSAAVNIASPIKPQKSLITVSSSFLGLGLGVAFVLLRAFFNQGVKRPEDIEKLGLPIYASIPKSDAQSSLVTFIKTPKQNQKDECSHVLSLIDPQDLAVEAIRSLRTSLHFAMMDAKNNVLMVSGPSPQVGKTFVASNLAAVIALSGKKVLLIDGDLRKGLVHEQFNRTNNQGLSDFLSGQVEVQEIIRNSDLEGLNFVSRGTLPPNPSELLMHPRFDDFILDMSSHYDLVIIDTAPLLAVTDAAIVGKRAGTTILVIRYGENNVKEIALTRQKFERAGVAIKGAVLNNVIKTSSSARYGYYSYSYQ